VGFDYRYRSNYFSCESPNDMRDAIWLIDLFHQEVLLIQILCIQFRFSRRSMASMM